MEQQFELEQRQEQQQELTEISVPTFQPVLDTDKSIAEQASDVITIMGAHQASKDAKFVDKIAESFARGVINEQEAVRLKKENLYAEQFFLKWRDVLKMAHVTETQGLGLMKTVVWAMIIPYFIMRFIGFFFMIISETFQFFNTLFNSVFGETKSVQLDANGKKVAQKTGYNIFAKLLLGFIIISMMLALALFTLRAFTGFDAFMWLRSLFGNE